MKRQLSKIVDLPGNSEDLLQLAAQGAEIGAWYWDEVRQKLDWDLKTCEMFGVPPDGKITLQTFIDALHPDDRDGVMRHWRHCVENRVPFSSDMRTVRPDNSVRWIHGRGKGYYDKSGEPISMVGLAFDITERKQIEQQLARVNEQLRLALEAGAVGGWDWTLKVEKLTGSATRMPNSACHRTRPQARLRNFGITCIKPTAKSCGRPWQRPEKNMRNSTKSFVLCGATAQFAGCGHVAVATTPQMVSQSDCSEYQVTLPSTSELKKPCSGKPILSNLLMTQSFPRIWMRLLQVGTRRRSAFSDTQRRRQSGNPSPFSSRLTYGTRRTRFL